jgi:hypothetical protein
MSVGRVAAPEPLAVGGIDLSNVDLSRPFWVDFSVPAHSLPDAKLAALGRLRFAMDALSAQFPGWVCEPEVCAPEGRFVLVVTPFANPGARVARAVVGT